MAWTSPRTWVAGETVTAALMNTHLRDQMLDLNGTASPWTAYAPATTLVTLGNGTLTAAFKQSAKQLLVRLQLTFGSTTALTGIPTFSMPSPGGFSPATVHQALAGFAFDSSAANAFLLSGAINITSGLIHAVSTGGLVTNLIPFTWAVGDYLVLTGVVESA